MTSRKDAPVYTYPTKHNRRKPISIEHRVRSPSVDECRDNLDSISRRGVMINLCDRIFWMFRILQELSKHGGCASSTIIEKAIVVMI